MSPAQRSAPAVRRPLSRLAPPLLLLLLLRPPAAAGDCSPPSDLANAKPALEDRTNFAEQSTVTYKCNEGFVKVPGKADSVICLDNKWSEVEEFCNRSCDVPTRLLFASLKKSYSNQNYFPEGSTVEYDCRLGYRRDHSLSGKLTCLQNFKWSKPDEFCKKKSCPYPEEIKNGNIDITQGILFGSSIYFSCNTGYKLVGATSSFCSIGRDSVEWSDQFPECQEILCPKPPKIHHGMIQDEESSYAYGQSVTYKCMEGFTLHGNSSIYCTVKDDQGEWSDPPPECKDTSQIYKFSLMVQELTTVNVPGTKAPPYPQKSTTVNVSATEAPPTPPELITVHVAATEAPPTPQKPATIHVPATEAPPTPQKPATIHVPATEAPPTPQKPATIHIPATEAPPTPQKPATVHIPGTEAPPTPQKPTTVHVPATEAPPTPQKLTKISSSATKSPLVSQKPTTVNVPATEVPSTPQKPFTANNSATTAPHSPTSNTLSTAVQNPIMPNASAPQASSTTQRFTTAKSSLIQNLRATQKSTAVHSAVTKGLHTTQRLTSAHVTAAKNPAVPRATAGFHATSTPKGGGSSPSVASVITLGLSGGTKPIHSFLSFS
ncbi:complement decay-accelerating factor isoform X2 [Hippopotamus amphibius kiboko]|uniref:complement decay-accelerating factor isoform X2 n=1 Tax=Hippopotamus amphibius kiboko TaxID=575201 RepID=UPI0025918B9C|nr:complement decay-accelerating factor isoform X2 [Hippopotamus amphibius kiboko]